MNKEIRAALLQTQKLLGKKFLDDRLRVGSCLADLLGGRYPGERRLLLLLMEADIPGMIQRGQVNGENVASKAHYLAQTYYADETMLNRGIRVWHAVLKGVELPIQSAPQQPKPAPKSSPAPKTPKPAPVMATKQTAPPQQAEPKPLSTQKPPQVSPRSPSPQPPKSYTNSIGMEFGSSLFQVGKEKFNLAPGGRSWR